MLSALSIRDFVIVESLDLEFAGGFTVLTGETGAGKSILIDALQFALGERADPDRVRDGCARAEVVAEFQCDPRARAWLAEQSLEHGHRAGQGADEPLLVRRVLDGGGRSRAFINGTPATLSQVRELGELLLDVHGQHAHQLLLRAPAQQQLLDEHGALHEPASRVRQAHAQWRETCHALAQAHEAHEGAAARTETLRERVADLSSLAPQPGEWERVEAEQRRLAHGAALIDGARATLDELAESDEAVQTRIARLQSRLDALCGFDAGLAPLCAALAAAQIQLEEAAHGLSQYLARGEFDQRHQATVEERISALHAASRRWRCPPMHLPELLEDSRRELEGMARAQDLDALRAAAAQSEKHYRETASALSRARRDAAARMGEAVTAAMQGLAMPGGRFAVEMAPSEPGPTGIDRIEFLVSGHAGTTPRPLARAASGGELSRIGLAIAVVAANANPVPTLIFDEVDAGIGGQVAATVGRLLRELGASRQVFCITHLPQVASFAKHHFAVRKSQSTDGHPVSSTEILSGHSRVQEVARMLGGEQVTPVTLQHAKEMLEVR